MSTEVSIRKAIKEALSATVTSFSLIPEGENNWAYKVTTPERTVLLRVPKIVRPGLLEKLRWVEKTLAARDLPHAKLLYAAEDAGVFPGGFMVFEYIESLDRHDALVSGKISLEDFHRELGQLLAKVHSIALPVFGQLPSDLGRTDSDFIEHNIADAARVLGEAETWEKQFPKGLQSQVTHALTRLLPLRAKLTPVLCHTDPAPDNCLWNKQLGVVLIDWDGALATTWVVDLADLTYSGSHLSELGPREERRKRILASFLEGHGLGDFSYDELLRLEHVLHILKAVHHFPYYYKVQKNYDHFWKTVDRLQELLA